MAFDFDSLKDRAKDLAQTGVAKAKEFTDVAVEKGRQATEIGKLKVQNATEQENVKKAYIELGKLYYTERGSSPEPEFAALCASIEAALAKVDYNNERIADMRAAGGAEDGDAGDDGGEPSCCCGCDEPDEPDDAQSL